MIFRNKTCEFIDIIIFPICTSGSFSKIAPGIWSQNLFWIAFRYRFRNKKYFIKELPPLFYVTSQLFNYIVIFLKTMSNYTMLK